MNAEELFRTWPNYEKANAETLLAFQAWCLPVLYGDARACLRNAEAPVDDLLNIVITLDGEERILGLASSELFSDLHLLWAKRMQLPRALLLALVERFCSPFLQTLENAMRRQLVVKDIVEDPATISGERRSFTLAWESGKISFALNLAPADVLAWGRMQNIDLGHQAVRTLVRPVRAEYASLDILDVERTRLGVGSALLLDGDSPVRWCVSRLSDDLVHVLSSETQDISFAQLADDDLPPVPASEGRSMELVRDGKLLARGTCVRLGLVHAVKITEVL